MPKKLIIAVAAAAVGLSMTGCRHHHHHDRHHDSYEVRRISKPQHVKPAPRPAHRPLPTVPVPKRKGR